MTQHGIYTVYTFAWRNNAKRKTLYGRRCIVLHRGKKNSCLIEMLDDGSRECVSRNSLRRAK